MGLGDSGVLADIEVLVYDLPFKILGFDSDNGNDLQFRHLYDELRWRMITGSYTRSRPYEIYDYAHIEMMNWTIVRQHTRYNRIETRKAGEMMNRLYRNEFTMFLNFFIPSMILISNEWIGSKIVKMHDDANTPYQRALDSEFIDETTKGILTRIISSLNPFNLDDSILLLFIEIHDLSIYN